MENNDKLNKKFFFPFILGITFIIVGFVIVLSDFLPKEKETDTNYDKPVKLDMFEMNLENTCWNNEVITENPDQKRKLICFNDDGTFTYEYTDGEVVEGFENYKTFKHKDDTITLISDSKDFEDIEMKIYSVEKEKTLTLKYQDKLVYFIYYCRL